MKKKILVATMTLTAISSIYAAQGKGYREYGEKIEQSPGTNFHLEEMPPGSYDTVVANNKKKSCYQAEQEQVFPAETGE